MDDKTFCNSPKYDTFVLISYSDNAPFLRTLCHCNGSLFCYFFFFLRQGLCISSWPWTYYIAQSVLKLSILLPWPPEFGDHRHVTPHLVLQWFSITKDELSHITKWLPGDRSRWYTCYGFLIHLFSVLSNNKFKLKHHSPPSPISFPIYKMKEYNLYSVICVIKYLLIMAVLTREMINFWSTKSVFFS
jgi:hypothetical protein